MSEASIPRRARLSQDLMNAVREKPADHIILTHDIKSSEPSARRPDRFMVEEDGKIGLKPATHDIHDLEGILHRPGMKAVSAEDMKKAFRKRFKKK